MRITLIIAVFSVLGAAYYINSHLPRLPQIAGLHEQKPTENVVYIKFHRDSTLSAADKVLTEAITSHEMVHDFRARGIFDIDVPIAAVTGYYIEWLRTD